MIQTKKDRRIKLVYFMIASAKRHINKQTWMATFAILVACSFMFIAPNTAIAGEKYLNTDMWRVHNEESTVKVDHSLWNRMLET